MHHRVFTIKSNGRRVTPARKFIELNRSLPLPSLKYERNFNDVYLSASENRYIRVTIRIELRTGENCALKYL